VARKFPIKAGEQIALGLLLVAGFAIPGHGQQLVNGSQPTNSPAAEATADNPQLSQEVLEELDAMKKRIEQLEAQLKERGFGDPNYGHSIFHRESGRSV